MGRENQHIQLVSRFCTVNWPTIGKQLPSFPHKVRGLNPQTSEVGGECVTTMPPWPPVYVEVQAAHSISTIHSFVLC